MGSLGLAPGKVSLTPGFIAEQMDRAVFHSFVALFLRISWGRFHWFWEHPHPHLLQFLLCISHRGCSHSASVTHSPRPHWKISLALPSHGPTSETFPNPFSREAVMSCGSCRRTKGLVWAMIRSGKGCALHLPSQQRLSPGCQFGSCHGSQTSPSLHRLLSSSSERLSSSQHSSGYQPDSSTAG